MTTGPTHIGRKHNRPNLLYILRLAQTRTREYTQTRTGPCTQEESDRQRPRAKVRSFPFHSAIQGPEIIHCVQVGPPMRELTHPAAAESVRLDCVRQKDRQADRQSITVNTKRSCTRADGARLRGTLNNGLSLPRHRH